MKKALNILFALAAAILIAMPVATAKDDDMGGLGVWSTNLGGQANQRENKEFKAFQDNVYITTAGFDKVITPYVRAGASFGYGLSDANFKINTPGYGSYGVDDDSFTIAGTITYDSINLCESRKRGKYSPEAVRNQGIDGWYVDSAMAFTQHNYEVRTERFNLALAPNMEVGKGDDHGQEFFVGSEAGYIYNMGCDKSIHLTPFTTLTYDHLYQNTLRVKGLGVNDYKIKGEGSNSLEQGFGLKLAKSLVSEKMGTFIPFVKGAWLIDYIHDIQSHNRERNAGIFGAGIIFLNKGRMTVSANWDMQVRNRLLENIGYGTVRYDF